MSVDNVAFDGMSVWIFGFERDFSETVVDGFFGFSDLFGCSFALQRPEIRFEILLFWDD